MKYVQFMSQCFVYVIRSTTIEKWFLPRTSSVTQKQYISNIIIICIILLLENSVEKACAVFFSAGGRRFVNFSPKDQTRGRKKTNRHRTDHGRRAPHPSSNSSVMTDFGSSSVRDNSLQEIIYD